MQERSYGGGGGDLEFFLPTEEKGVIAVWKKVGLCSMCQGGKRGTQGDVQGNKKSAPKGRSTLKNRI